MTATATTMHLASWVSQLRYEQIPKGTIDTVRRCLLDSIGCGIFGRKRDTSEIVKRWAREGARLPRNYPGATAWGDARPAFRPSDAALVNGVTVHGFELDDYHNAKLHPGAAVIPAAVAMAEHIGATGKSLLTAIAVGYEVMIRSSIALNPTVARLRGWHLTGVCGPLGAAAACASLLQLDDIRTAWALGLAGTQSSGLWAFNADGAMSKRFHPGRASQAGVMAAELAARGLSGPTQLYEAEDGSFLCAFSDGASGEVLTSRLGHYYHLDTIALKPYAACASTHAYIDAALKLRARFGEKLKTLEAIKIGCTKVVDVQCGFQYIPSSPLVAQMSVRYCVAHTILRGAPAPKHFDEPYLANKEVVELAQSIKVERSQELEDLFPEHLSGWVAAKIDGHWERVKVIDPLGSQGNPINWAGIVAKSRTLLEEQTTLKRLRFLEDFVANVEGKSCRELTKAMCAVTTMEEPDENTTEKVAI